MKASILSPSLFLIICSHAMEIDELQNQATKQLFGRVEKTDIARVQKLLDNGANINARNSEDRTPLNVAIWTGYYDMIKLLLERDADVNDPGNGSIDTPLDWAIHYYEDETAHNDINIIKLLLENGAHVNTGNQYDATPLMSAAFWDKHAIIKLLIAAGSDHTITDHLGRTATDYASQDSKTKIILKDPQQYRKEHPGEFEEINAWAKKKLSGDHVVKRRKK